MRTLCCIFALNRKRKNMNNRELKIGLGVILDIMKSGERVSQSIAYLYCKICMVKFTQGRYDIKKIGLTKNEIYNYLPVLIEMGWLTKSGQVNSVWGVSRARQVQRLAICDVTQDNLKSIDHFKAFLLAASEGYLLKWRASKLKKGEKTTDSHMPLTDGKNYVGPIYNTHIENLLGIEAQTIRKWRKKSAELGYSSYNHVLSRVTITEDEKRKVEIVKQSKPLEEKWKNILGDIKNKTEESVNYLVEGLSEVQGKRKFVKNALFYTTIIGYSLINMF